MSYILEALRRAQNERERGQVPGLHAQPARHVAEPAPHAGVAVPWPVFLAVAGVLVVGLAVWWWRTGTAPAPAAPMASVTVSATAAAQPSRPVPAAALPVVVSAPAVPAPRVPAPAVAPAVATAAAPAAPAVATAVAPAPPVTGSAAAAPTSRAVPRVLSLAELTPAQRRDLPPLAMGGSIWSESALGRFVIVNGQVVREGEAAAPGVTVERIAPKSVQLRWRELRFEVPL